MKNRIITISREFGSGGRTIGKRVAQELGIPCYDSELLQKIAEENGFHENYIKEAGEYAPGGFLASAFSHHPSGPNNADYLWKIQFRIITELAEKGPCVIVGRCADYVLRGKADCLRVFIHADMEFRANRIVNVYGESAHSAIHSYFSLFFSTCNRNISECAERHTVSRQDTARCHAGTGSQGRKALVLLLPPNTSFQFPDFF